MKLQLSLKKNWFEMTKSGIKTEDYREINIYWSKRLIINLKDILIYRESHYSVLTKEEENYNYLIQNIGDIKYKDFKTNTMTLGYPKSTDTERILKFKHNGIEIRTGNPAWGAQPDKLYFVILHGSPIS